MTLNIPYKKSIVFSGLGEISHGFFGRQGGVSQGKYASLNVGQGSDDNPDHVTKNRSLVAVNLGTDERSLLSVHQYHSTEVVIADGPWSGERPKADAIVTGTPGLAISALAADCAPVLFADPHARIIGAAHAGWRGALAGVTDKTVEAMEALGAKRSNIVAAVGPCIGPDSFEVGPEFVDQFMANHVETKDLFTPGTDDRSYFDVKTYLIRRLEGLGLTSVDALPDCTYAQPDDYFSYRYNSHKGIADYGRNISVIMLLNDNV
jgi:YfiH family protein